MKIIGVCSLLAGLAAVAACASDGGPEVAGADGASGQYNANLDYAQVEFVEAVEQRSDDSDVTVWRFSVRVRHRDQGWDHYADEWQVIDHETNEIYGVRELAHPHDNEQPFTRNQRGIEIPPSVTLVRVRAKCNVHGFGGREIVVDLSRDTSGEEGDRRVGGESGDRAASAGGSGDGSPEDAQARDVPGEDYTVTRL